MASGLDKFSTAPMTMKDYLRKQAQEDMKELNSRMPAKEATSEPDVRSIVPFVAPEQPMTPDVFSQPEQPKMNQQKTILGKSAPITQAFGNVNPGVEVFSRGGVNSGTDFGVPTGTTVAVPPGEWEVMDAFTAAKGQGHIGDNTNSGYGNSVLVKNKKTGEKMRFSHLSQVGVQPGQVLEGGSVIGASGGTGNVTGDHLDLEFYNQNGQLEDILKSLYAAYLGMQQ